MSSSLPKLISDSLDFTSVKSVVGAANQAMVYGWGHCYYRELASKLEKSSDSPIKKVFNYQVGNPQEKAAQTLEGRAIERIKVFHKPNKNQHRVCKAGITDLVLENYKRAKEGREIIPIIFCVDKDQNPTVSTTKTVSSKKKETNVLITNSELRRCYKLCKELENSSYPELREMASIAKQTFKFVKIDQKGGKAILTQLSPLWEKEDFVQQWKARQEVNKSRKQSLENLENLQKACLNEITAIEQEINKKSSESEKIDLKNLKTKLKAAKSKHKILSKKIDKVKSLIPKQKEEVRWDKQLLAAAQAFNRTSKVDDVGEPLDFDSI